MSDPSTPVPPASAVPLDLPRYPSSSPDVYAQRLTHARPPSGTNGFAVASLVFGVIGGVLFAVVFGVVALVQIPRRNQHGWGLAIGGLAASGCWLLVLVVVVIAAVGGDPDAGSASLPDRVSITSGLHDGDCVNGLSEAIGEAKITQRLPVVACAEPHDGEVLATWLLSGGPYPGDEVVQRRAGQGCESSLGNYAPTVDTTDLLPYTLFPTKASWARGDRQVVCLAANLEQKIVGSIKDRRPH